MSGTPVTPIMGSKPTHLSPPARANRVESPSCTSPRTLMPHALATCQAAKLRTARATENNTSGGSRETELNELTVIPRSPSGARVVTTATPVGKAPSAFRNSLDVKVIPATQEAIVPEVGPSLRGPPRGP